MSSGPALIRIWPLACHIRAVLFLSMGMAARAEICNKRYYWLAEWSRVAPRMGGGVFWSGGTVWLVATCCVAGLNG